MTAFYYIDTSVLLENIPLVKLIKATSGTRVVYFPYSHTWVYRWRNFRNFPPLFYPCLFVYIIQRRLHGGLKIWILFSRGKAIFYSRAALVHKILFFHSKIKFISSRHRVISSFYITTWHPCLGRRAVCLKVPNISLVHGVRFRAQQIVVNVL